MRPTSERALVQRARRGDEAAAAELFSRHWTRAWRLARAIAGGRADADDIAQTALARAFAHLGDFDEARPLRPWLDRIVTRAAVDHLRTGARLDGRRLEASDEPGEAPDDEDRVPAGVAAAVLALSPERRVVVVLRYWADLGIDEIASQLELPAGTVSSRLSRALAELRTTIEVERDARPAR